MRGLFVLLATVMALTTGQAQTVVNTTRQAASYVFVVADYPANTPHDAHLYVTGNFNYWNPANPAYELRKQPDGTYRVTVQTDLDELTYKFTRGDWNSVEGWRTGKARPNRVLHRMATATQPETEVTIESWEDLSGTFHFYSVYDLLMLFSAFQGLLLLIAIPSIQNYNRPANRWLVALLGSTSLFILVRAVSGYRDVAQAYTKLLLVPDFILFSYAPLFYIYIRRLLFNNPRPAMRWLRLFIPVAVQFLVYLPLFLMDDKLLQLRIVNHDPLIQGLFLGMGFAGLLYNAGYWWLCLRTIRSYRQQYQTGHSSGQNVQYLTIVLIIQAICLVIWAFLFVLVGVGQALSLDVLAIAEKNVDAVWLTFSCIAYILGYFAIHQPEIFKLPDAHPQPSVPPILPVLSSSLVDKATAGVGAVERVMRQTIEVSNTAPVETADELRLLMQQVDSYVGRYKPYINPNLTLAELSAKLKLQPHVLSRVINDGFHKNFFDFINYHRIEELKRRVNDPHYKNFTLLSLAFEVGFNSKTAFNRAFKKQTQQTPSEYFNAMRV